MRLSTTRAAQRNAQRGYATLIAIVLLGIMVGMISADIMAVRVLDRNLKLIEKRQTQRLKGSAPASQTPATNNPAPRRD
jgi:hypothetical protein